MAASTKAAPRSACKSDLKPRKAIVGFRRLNIAPNASDAGNNDGTLSFSRPRKRHPDFFACLSFRSTLAASV